MLLDRFVDFSAESATFGTGERRQVSPPPPSLQYELDPKSHCPGASGLFHCKGNANGYEPHRITSGLRARPLPRPGWPIPPGRAPGLALLLPPSKLIGSPIAHLAVNRLTSG